MGRGVGGEFGGSRPGWDADGEVGQVLYVRLYVEMRSFFLSATQPLKILSG